MEVDTIEVALRIGNTARAADGSNYDWTVFVEPAGHGHIMGVTYHLHPTFNPSTVGAQRDARGGFRLTRRGWGTFTVHADVALADGTVHRLAHELAFGAGGAARVVTLPLALPEVPVE